MERSQDLQLHVDKTIVINATANHKRTGVHKCWDAKIVCSNLILFFPNSVQTASLNVKTTKRNFVNELRCLYA